MPIEKYVSPITSRMAVFENLINLKNCAVIDYSTMGHGLYNYGYIPRLTSQDTPIKSFMTHISETDIVLGSTKKLYQAVEELISEYNFDAIFIMPSAIASVIGFDLKGVSRDLTAKFNKPIISFDVGLAEDYYQGNCVACAQLIQTFCKQSKRKTNTYNILGNFANEFNYKPDTAEIIRIMENALGQKVNFVYNEENSLDDFASITRARYNLVTSKEATKTAEYLKQEYNMPYFYFRPYGFEGTVNAIEDLRKRLNVKANDEFLRSEEKRYTNVFAQMRNIVKFQGSKISIYAKYDVAYGINEFLVNELNAQAEAYCDLPDSNIPYCTYDNYIDSNREFNGVILSSDPVLRILGRDDRLQIDNPIQSYKMISPYDKPLVGFSGACHLCQMLASQMMK